MKSRSFRILLAVAIVAVLLSASGAAYAKGGNIFKDETSTVDGYRTWDSDMINIENVAAETGDGVYVAVLDTGLVPNWRDYFPEDRIATDLGTGFDQSVTFRAKSEDGCEYDVEVGRLRQTTWVGSTDSMGGSHGTHVASTIIGYFYRSNSDLYAGFPLPPIMVRGLAPNVTIIPVKVLADYRIPALPKCTDPGPLPAQSANFGTSEMIAAGIDYATDLAMAGYRPMVINMSLGGPELDPLEQAAIDRAIANGVIVVAAAGNEGEEGMGFPGAYPPVISAGSAGWIQEWQPVVDDVRYRMWWLQYSGDNMLAGSGDVADPTNVNDVYVSDFSSRAFSGQQLDVLAPGSWVRGPFPGNLGYAHLPWWSKGIADLISRNPGNFYYVGGTSMATPQVSSVAALMLEKNPALTQTQVESILKATTLNIPDSGGQNVYDYDPDAGTWGSMAVTWDTDCGGVTCDPVGAGLIQADGAVAAVP